MYCILYIELGLEYIPQNFNFEEKKSDNLLIPSIPKQTKQIDTSLWLDTIFPSQIRASSYEDNYEPNECRLNNPRSCWKPSKRGHLEGKFIKCNRITNIQLMKYSENPYLMIRQTLPPERSSFLLS